MHTRATANSSEHETETIREAPRRHSRRKARSQLARPGHILLYPPCNPPRSFRTGYTSRVPSWYLIVV